MSFEPGQVSPSPAPETGAAAASAGLIVREEEPLNLEMRFSSLDGFITPADRFYVRCHFSIPKVEAAAWRLRVEGEVSQSLELSLAELESMPARTVVATLECAGNGRAHLESRHEGTQWESGAIGNAEWQGVPLSEVLSRAGLNAGVAEVILEGADQGYPEKPVRPGDPIRFARSVPLDKALRDVLLAFRMNGQPLSRAHGFPVRAIVPGWFGMASVKWLRRVIASAEPFHGYFQTIEYAAWRTRPDGQKTLVPLAEQALKAAVARPVSGEVIPAGRDYLVHGAAWSGSEPVTRVELSSDGGANWQEARLLGQPCEHAWLLWEFRWRTPAVPGPVTLIARAQDAAGRVQPEERDHDLGSYAVHHRLPVKVELR
ncbi:MAG: sulfite oxidase [Verrucomicrobia bacterium]|nr:sulfite oxidase [Verrucomicrobiota bacterium]